MDQYCAQKMFDELQKAGGKASMETVKLAVCGTTCTMAIIMGKNAVNIGQHYFHNEDLSEAMLTDIHGIFPHNL